MKKYVLYFATLEWIVGLVKKIVSLTEDHYSFAKAQSSSFFSSVTLSDIRSLHRSYLSIAPFERICQIKIKGAYFCSLKKLKSTQNLKHFPPVDQYLRLTLSIYFDCKDQTHLRISCVRAHSHRPEQTKGAQRKLHNEIRIVCFGITCFWWWCFFALSKKIVLILKVQYAHFTKCLYDWVWEGGQKLFDVLYYQQTLPPLWLSVHLITNCFVPVRCPQQRYVVMVITVGRKNLFREHYYIEK